MSIIECPQCDAEVNEIASCCPNCGHSFPVNWKYRAIGALVLAIVGFGVYALLLREPRGYDSGPTASVVSDLNVASPALALEPDTASASQSTASPPPAPVRKIVRFTVMELLVDYAHNAVATNLKIGDAAIEVTGPIASIEEDSTHHPVINLNPGSDGYPSVGLTMKTTEIAHAATLSPMSAVSILCDSMSDTYGLVRGDNCVFVSLNEKQAAQYKGLDRTAKELEDAGPRQE